MPNPNGYEEWRSLCKKGCVDRVLLWTGKERYLKLQALEELAAILMGQGNLDRLTLEAKGMIPDTLTEILTGGSIFASQRLVVIKEGDHLSSEVEAALADLIPHLPPTTHLVVLAEGENLLRRKLGKTVAVHGRVLFFRPLFAREAVAWVMDHAKRRGLQLTEAAAAELVARLGTETGQLDQEIAKLATYWGDRTDPVTPEVIREISGPPATGAAFELSEAITNGDRRRALQLLEDLLRSGESPVFLTATLARQFHLLLAAKACVTQGLSISEAAPALDHLPSFVLQRLYQQQRRFSPEELGTRLLRIINTDWRLKNGLAPVPATELALLVQDLL